MTVFAPTERGLSETTSRIWEWRGRNDLPAVLTSTRLNSLTNTPTLTDLRQMLVEEWDVISQQCVSKLVTSMTRRCQAVVAAHDSSTCYLFV
uniref:Uncharacterized protein n=1 Tax=Neolamprologus brichardi TaxID=32507 RepID=A0A3Q4HFF7_NEOBR